MSELYYAEMEAARNEAEDAYFKARPGIPDEPTPQWNPRRLFRAGFERGFKHQWDERHADQPDLVTISDSISGTANPVQPQAGACPQCVELEKSRDGWMYECQQYMEKCRAVLQRPGDKGQIQPTSDSATDKSVLAP